MSPDYGMSPNAIRQGTTRFEHSAATATDSTQGSIISLPVPCPLAAANKLRYLHLIMGISHTCQLPPRYSCFGCKASHLSQVP